MCCEKQKIAACEVPAETSVSMQAPLRAAIFWSCFDRF